MVHKLSHYVHNCQVSLESNILGNLSLNMKKLLTVTGDVNRIFKLQDVGFLVNNFKVFFEFETKHFSTLVTSQKHIF